jgi:hypothetical protein
VPDSLESIVVQRFECRSTAASRNLAESSQSGIFLASVVTRSRPNADWELVRPSSGPAPCRKALTCEQAGACVSDGPPFRRE